MTEQFKEEQNNNSTNRRKNSPQNAEKEHRIPGTWAHKGTFTEDGDGKITLEEFFGVKSLDEVEPITMINRFKEAQKKDFEQACIEFRNGRNSFLQ